MMSKDSDEKGGRPINRGVEFVSHECLKGTGIEKKGGALSKASDCPTRGCINTLDKPLLFQEEDAWIRSARIKPER